MYPHNIKIYICLISEKGSYLRFKGYCIYPTIHPSNSARGGSAIVKNQSVKHYKGVPIVKKFKGFQETGEERIKKKRSYMEEQKKDVSEQMQR